MIRLVKKIANFKTHLRDLKERTDYYGYDLWEDIKNKVKEGIPKGFTLYGEALGYDKNGSFIQGGYDYDCEVGEMKLEIYRITYTNFDGNVIELNFSQIQEFCERYNLPHSHLFYNGPANELFPDIRVDEKWHENFLGRLENEYCEKDCFMCQNKVPEEGVVLRKESLFGFEAYKLKSFRFLEHETEQLDKGESDMESEN